MYQAIVFLPLLGCIIAGLISLAGARARFPGRSPGAGAEDTTHDHGPHTGGGAPSPEGDHAAIYHPSTEELEHGSHVEQEPAAAGSPLAEGVTTTLLFISMVLAWIVFVRFVWTTPEPAHVPLLDFIVSGDLKVVWSLRIDTLTAVMLVVVTTVSALVHLYSIGYMAEDPYRPRFFAYLSLFTFAMLMLVTADNLVQLFFGWEGVGLASYLLIGFWYYKPEANAAAIKAFIVNRVGDFGFALGIFAAFMMTGAIDLDTIFNQAPAIAQAHKTIHLLGHDLDAMTLICLLLFMGAMGKSAQFLLHTWLPDAMEGPTPVSALIHAATMVTAGVFMVARLSPLFELSPTAQAVVTGVGGMTAFFAATVGLVQNDIKRIVAYSTCSQLGYMFVAMGVGAYSVGMFHLFTHAFFKALLFLGSGSVITAMHHEQDIRKMGGLWRKIPLTYVTMFIGTLALTGFPLTAGYFSKDKIIEAAFTSASAGVNPLAGFGYGTTLIAAALTAFYSWRLMMKTFHGAPNDTEHYEAAHESPKVMLVPLIVLAAGSLLAGYPFLQLFAGTGVREFFGQSIAANDLLEKMEATPFWIGMLPTIAMLVGLGLAYLFYIRKPNLPVELARQHQGLYKFLLNKWYFDELYDLILVRPTLRLARILWRYGDGWLIDGFGPDGISARVLDVTRNAIRLQTGYLYHYAFAMLIGAAAAITWFKYLSDWLGFGGH
ncbi:MAG TPA: NADH-quinone oxidoreductase subunit L [Xanthobacteraceae bacterium]|nr:NADH-quinone oxidoreductase subunit L [Xanthobacteraceae bacterium]